MKLSKIIAVIFCAYAQSVQAKLIEASTAPIVTSTDYKIVEVGNNHRKWSKAVINTVGGHVTYTTNSYIELVPGQYYVRNGATGLEWAESKEEIQACAGGAVAQQGALKMAFANNLASVGSIDVQLPDGMRVRSHPLCLSYYDTVSQQSVIIATIQDCQGQIIAPNQVIYENAFSGVDCAIRYTYTRRSWEQDVIVNPDSLPLPEEFGLSSQSVVLQVLTEFLDMPTPAKVTKSATISGVTVQEESLDWGSVRFGCGKAFFQGNSDKAAINVNKRWVETQGRHILIEELPVSVLLQNLQNKPQAAEEASLHKQLRNSYDFFNKLPVLENNNLVLVQQPPMQVASQYKSTGGFLIDYIAISADQTNFVFAADTTYLIPSYATVNFAGTTVFEGGTVVKFVNSANSTNVALSFYGPVVFQTAPYRMAVFTSKDDNSVGDSIAGSTGNPTPLSTTYLDFNLPQTNAISWIRCSYANIGFRGISFLNGIWNSQFVKCNRAIEVETATALAVRNSLFSVCTNVVTTLGSFSGEHLTIDRSTTLLAGTGSTGNLTNCIVSAVTTLGSVNRYFSPQYASGTGVFQTNGAGNYYLVNSSTNRNAGTSNINNTLAGMLKLQTTYPPLTQDSVSIVSPTIWTNTVFRDIDNLDIGYHYVPIDYMPRSINLQSTLTLTNGVAIAGWGIQMFNLGSNSLLNSSSRVENVNHIVWYPAVQEQSVSLTNIATRNSYIAGSMLQGASITLFATEVAMQGARQSFWSGPAHGTILSIKDSSLYGVDLSPYNQNSSATTYQTWTIQNNLFERCYLTMFSGVQLGDPGLTNPVSSIIVTMPLIGTTVGTTSKGKLSGGGGGGTTYINNPVSVNIYNNLFHNGGLILTFNDGFASFHPTWAIKDNLFDQATNYFTGTGNIGLATRSNNGFSTGTLNLLSGTQDVESFVPDYVQGQRGNYYYPTSGNNLSRLINAGSQYASAAGLSAYTTTTDQVLESSSVVDIGMHYRMYSGIANDQDGDGLSDSIEIAMGLDSYNPDSDFNGITDFTQNRYIDTDGDGMPNWWELTYGLNPNSSADASGDADTDGLTNLQEYINERNPIIADSMIGFINSPKSNAIIP